MRLRPFLPAMVACAIASPALLARPEQGLEAWVRFGGPASLESVRAIVASEVPGDATLQSLSVDDGMLRVDGRLGLDRGSRWSTLGAEIAPDGVEAGADMSAARVLRIRLASAVARPLRVRIKGSDREIGNAGCYPVVVQMVTAAPADYLMPLSAFRSPGWCGTSAPSIEQTLHAVQRVEVTANDEPAGGVSFSVGRIDFLADDGGEPEPGPRQARQREEPPVAIAAAPASRPAPAGRRRAAAAGPSASAPATPRRVTCEFSVRYQLMLCY